MKFEQEMHWDVVVMWTEINTHKGRVIHWATTDYNPPARHEGLNIRHGAQQWEER